HIKISHYVRRIGLLAAAGLLLTACGQEPAQTQSAAQEAHNHNHEHAAQPGATTPLRKLAGQHEVAKDGLGFKGVHYGQSTEGEDRFRPPQPVAPWDGVKDATQFGPVRPQGGEAGRKVKGSDELLPMSEGCLVLNVWTPALDDAKRPVMVWLHG